MARRSASSWRRELQKRSTGRTVYVLDEPTTGLHFEDIRKLLKVLESLVDKGNTVIVIEHNLDVIKTADWLIDMGPEGGHKGGLLIAAGTPEEVAEVPDSATGELPAARARPRRGGQGRGEGRRAGDEGQRHQGRPAVGEEGRRGAGGCEEGRGRGAGGQEGGAEEAGDQSPRLTLTAAHARTGVRAVAVRRCA